MPVMLYTLANGIYPWLTLMMALACLVGAVHNAGGTRRIAMVVAGAAIIAAVLGALDWPVMPRLFALTIINGLAAVPLLFHPVTARQQVIAALFAGLMVMHCTFAVAGEAMGPLPGAALFVNWAMSSAIDAVMSALLLWWSGGHAVRVAVDWLHRAGAALSGAAVARTPR